jgi:hypothetical protein
MIQVELVQASTSLLIEVDQRMDLAQREDRAINLSED